jgi:hypothetical protein
MDTSSVKVFLPGITDTRTLDAASKLCGHAAYKERGQEHFTRHDAAPPDLIRQLPPGFGLVIRGGCSPVIARLPRAWKDRAYKRARRCGLAIAALSPAPPPAARLQLAVTPDDLPPGPFPPGTSFPWT